MPRLLVQEAASPVGQRLASPDAFGAGVGRAAQQTGQVAQALGEVMNQYAESQGRASSIRYQQELEAEANRIALDPDIAGRPAKFEEAQRRLIGKHRPKIGGRMTYDQRSEFATQELRTDFTHRTALDGIKESRLNTDLEVQHSMMKMARAQSTEEVGRYMLEAREAIQASDLLYTPNEMTAKIQAAFGNGIRAMADVNPSLALKVIDDFGPMLGPEVTAVYREEAISNIRQGIAAENAAAREEDRLKTKAEKEASDAAEDELFELEIGGGLTVGAVAAAKDRLSPTAQRRWLDRAKGKGGDAAADPDTYMSLTDRAEAGEDIREDATLAASSGRITATQRNALLKTSRDQRFKPGRDAIKDALDPGATRTDFDMGTKRANALLEYDEWVKENPKATYEEATSKAHELIRVGSVRTKSSTSRAYKSREEIIEEGKRVNAQRTLIGEEAYRAKMKGLADALKEFEALEAAQNAGKGAQ